MGALALILEELVSALASVLRYLPQVIVARLQSWFAFFFW